MKCINKIKSFRNGQPKPDWKKLALGLRNHVSEPSVEEIQKRSDLSFVSKVSRSGVVGACLEAEQRTGGNQPRNEEVNRVPGYQLLGTAAETRTPQLRTRPTHCLAAVLRQIRELRLWGSAGTAQFQQETDRGQHSFDFNSENSHRAKWTRNLLLSNQKLNARSAKSGFNPLKQNIHQTNSRTHLIKRRLQTFQWRNDR